jgi:hypothetical protein
VDFGNAKSFTCPFHGWTYDAAGNLQWIRHLGTSGEEINGKIWADGLGNVFLATSTTGSPTT